MTDVHSKQKRSEIMSMVRGRNTGPEKFVRSMLHGLGYRFRLHRKDLPGRPDIVLPRFSTAIFVHGCFWHRHKNCRFATTPKTRADFWTDKFERNVARDDANEDALRKLGWQVIVIWSCELREKVIVEKRVISLLRKISTSRKEKESG